jgi:hypothetical protein
MKALAGVVFALFWTLLIGEFRDWCPRWAKWVIQRTAAKLEPGRRKKALAFWLGELDVIDGPVSKLVFALGTALSTPETLRRFRVARWKQSWLRPRSLPRVAFSTDRIPRRVLSLAVRMLPATVRQRYWEEWLAVMEEYRVRPPRAGGGSALKLFGFSLSLLVAAPRMALLLRRT